MWMAAYNLRWGIVGSECQLRIFRRDFRTLASGEIRPFLLMSVAVSVDSSTLQLTKLLLYMLLTGTHDLPHLSARYSFPVPAYDPMTRGKTRGQTRGLFGGLRSLTTSHLLGFTGGVAPAPSQNINTNAVCSC
jgi:hypothetical protein